MKTSLRHIGSPSPGLSAGGTCVCCKTSNGAGKGLQRTKPPSGHCFSLSVLPLPHHQASVHLNGQTFPTHAEDRGRQVRPLSSIPSLTFHAPLHRTQASWSGLVSSFFISRQVSHPRLLAKIMCDIFSYQFTISWQVELFVLLQISTLPYTSEFLNLLCLCEVCPTQLSGLQNRCSLSLQKRESVQVYKGAEGTSARFQRWTDFCWNPSLTVCL